MLCMGMLHRTGQRHLDTKYMEIHKRTGSKINITAEKLNFLK